MGINSPVSFMKHSSVRILLTLGFFLFLQTTASAQFLGEINLSALPQHPEPGESVKVSLGQYGFDTFGADIRWYVDGVELVQYRNERSAETTVGTLGTQTSVRAVVTQSGGLSLNSTLVLKPAVVDIIVEADTYVPYFYRGRALPNSESKITAIAVVNDGTSQKPSSYTYKWSVGDDVLFGGPVRGKNRAETSMQRFGNTTIAVEVMNLDGVVIAENKLLVVPQDPLLYFYESNPLLGLKERAIQSAITVVADEVTIHGEPYYLNTSSGALTGRSFNWKIDNQKVTTEESSPNMLTLRKSGVGGKSSISLEAISSDPIPKFVRGSFQLFIE